MPKAKSNQAYEMYQIITDFSDPLEIFREAFQNAVDEGATDVYCHVFNEKTLMGSKLIIDIWNNGKGLSSDDVECFFDLANTKKTDENLLPVKGKLGYKGHGTKIYFASESVIISSKTKNDAWYAQLDNAVKQIHEKAEIEYSDCYPSDDKSPIYLPNDWEEGFYLRIVGHASFKSNHTFFKLNHKYLRDYIKWYTVFGSVLTYFKDFPNIRLFLRSLQFDEFKNTYSEAKSIDPLPEFKCIDDVWYEELSLGHYFPEERENDQKMKSYAKRINTNKPYYDYFSKLIKLPNLDSKVPFNFIASIEGYETKRRYDILLTGRGKSREEISHSDSDRYGIWACKGGIPIERIDGWVEGLKGTFTFMQAFVDCDDFNLTANRGSINNTDIEILEIVKKEVNRIFGNKELKNAIDYRSDLEKQEKRIASIEEDRKNLHERYKLSEKKKRIKLPNGIIVTEPTKTRHGFSESETMVLLIEIMSNYPDLFPFTILDYNTYEGIDFVVLHQQSAKYIELKGLLTNKINHPFRYISKFICYELGVQEDVYIEDIEELSAKLKVNEKDRFESNDENYKNKEYRSYKLEPSSAQITSMEVIVLKNILFNILTSTFID